MMHIKLLYLLLTDDWRLITMKKILVSLFALCALFLVTACSAPQAENPPNHASPNGYSTSGETDNQHTQYQKMTTEEAKQRMDSGDPVIIVDVRTQEEYDESHIANAILIPNETISSEPPADLPDLDAQILLYCRSGNRSAQAARKLIDLGYTNVIDFGGIKDWPYEVVK